MDQILPILHLVKDDEKKLQQILDFLLEKIYDEPRDEIVIPEKYRELVRDIAQRIDSGLVCYINPETLEVEDIPKSLLDEGFDIGEGEEEDEMNLTHEKWEKCITVEPPVSHKSFAIMEDFVPEVDDKKLQNQLTSALNNRRPFANFKNLIDNSEYRETWFVFKQNKLEEYVWNELSLPLREDEEKED
jgi:hypothetical protein